MIKNQIIAKNLFLIILFLIFCLFGYSVSLSTVDGIQRLSDYNEIKDINVSRIYEKMVPNSAFDKRNGLTYIKGEEIPFDGIMIAKKRGDVIVGIYQYSNGKGHGIQNDYHENGNLSVKSIEDENGTGDALFYYPNGKLKRKAYYENDIAMKHTEYYESGKIKEILNSKGGLNAEVIGYYENGNKSYIMNIIQDYSVKGKINYLKNGESIAYEKNGNLWGILNFKNNSAYGLPQKLFKNGKLKYEFISAAEVGEKLETMTYFKEYFDKSDKLKLDCDEVSSGEWHCKEYKKDGTLKNEFTSPTYKPKKDNSFWINAFLGIWNILF